MSAAFPLTESDDSPPVLSAVPKNDSAPLRCAEPGCTNAVVKPARGRTPKFCEEHKITAKTGSSSNRGWNKAVEVENSLNRIVAGLGMGLSLINEIDGSIVAQGGPAVTHELVELAKTDKTLRKYLEWIAAPGKYGPLVMAVTGLLFPIAVNHNLIPSIFVRMPTQEGS
jgi:hypothetical protein